MEEVLNGHSNPTRPRTWRDSIGWFVALAGGLVTLVVALIPSLRFAYRSPELHYVLEASGGFAAITAGYLVYGRFRMGASRRDFFLACALLVLGVNGLILALPLIVGGLGSDTQIWSAATSRVLGASLFAWASFLPDAKVTIRRRGRPEMMVATIVLGSVLLSLVVGLLVNVDPGISSSLSPDASSRPALIGHPLLLSAQLVVMFMYAATAFGLSRSAQRNDDDLLHWLAAGATMLAIARLNYFLFPSIYSVWVYTGDFFRVGGQAMFLIGAAGEVGRYWQNLTQVAVMEERRRIAHDLHDGLAQELALIVGNSRRLEKRVAERDERAIVDIIRLAADRALREARAAISSLSKSQVEDFDVALKTTVEAAGARYGCHVDLHLEPGIDVPLGVLEAIDRITTEAIANAARHADAKKISVGSANDPTGWRLWIEDDGKGFDLNAAAASNRFGITTMRERARALGADLQIETQPERGTRVVVQFRR